ncbi:MAG: alpha/beta fold hydrolase [Vicinamibacteria bacterium]
MPDDTPQPDRTGHVEADGHRIWYEYFGQGDREAVCLLNGVGMHTGAWYGFLPRLRPEFDVILYDYPGQGDSTTHDVPCFIDRFGAYLTAIVDRLGIERFHLMGISYGGFVGLDYARQYQERLHSLTISGILLTHEVLFDMYQDISLRFYRGGPAVFELYTHYLYEKIFGESFVRKVQDRLPRMRAGFYERWKDKVHALVRLTLAQDPFFARLEENHAGYQAIRTPTLLLAGAEDRTIPPWVQRKIAGILPNARFVEVPDSGHVVYIEQPDFFFESLKRLARRKSLEGLELPA